VCPLILVKDFCAVMSALQAIYILRSAGTFFQFAWWFSYSSEGSMLVNLFCRQTVSLTVIDFWKVTQPALNPPMEKAGFGTFRWIVLGLLVFFVFGSLQLSC
jgi:hypothetical protein